MVATKLGTPRTDCTHKERYRTQGGYELCERCAELDAGWTPCKGWNCLALTPRDEPRCDYHKPVLSPGFAVCSECRGEGWVHCEEPDCHGEFCEDGDVDCGACAGSGEVEKVAS